MRVATAVMVLPAAVMAGCAQRAPLLAPVLLPQGPNAAFPATPHTPGENAAAVLGMDHVVLAGDGWVRTIRPATEARGSKHLPSHRWHYPDLEDLLSRPAGRRPDFRAALDAEDPIVVANAAIALSRLGAGMGSEALVAAARAPKLIMPMRCAAIEALGELRDPAPVDMLRELLDQYQRPGEDGRSHFSPELCVEALHALGRHVEPADDPRFTKALRSSDPSVRLAAVTLWGSGEDRPLPVEVADLRADSDPRVRASALRVLGRSRHPNAQAYLAAGLRDYDAGVRLAAVEALGALGGAQARATLVELLDSQGETIRAAVVAALATLGDEQAMTKAAGDPSWRVRAAVAENLSRYPNRTGAALAQQLLEDPSAEVQHRVIAAVEPWPLQRAGPILLAGMQHSGYWIRQTAARQLLRCWPPAEEFPIEGPADRRAEVLARLEDRFRQQFGFLYRDTGAAVDQAAEAPPRPVAQQRVARARQLLRPLADPRASASARREAIEALAQFGPDVSEVLGQAVADRGEALPEAVYREVLPKHEPVFAALEALDCSDVQARRRAAAEIERLATERPLGTLALARLAQLVLPESDLLVWQSVLQAVAAEPSEPAARLAYAAIGHHAPEVRRRACEHLAAHPDPEHAAVLLPVLEDSSPSVVEAAVRALAAGGRLDDTRPLRRLLRDGNDELQIEAAVALARLRDSTGPSAVERLAYSPNAKVRQRAAEAMGELADPEFVPVLVGMLDDRQSVCRAALESLPKAAGRDVTKDGPTPPANTSQRIDRWKRWFQSEQGAGVVARRAPLPR
jgi:HEAT repeat protein